MQAVPIVSSCDYGGEFYPLHTLPFTFHCHTFLHTARVSLKGGVVGAGMGAGRAGTTPLRGAHPPRCCPSAHPTTALCAAASGAAYHTVTAFVAFSYAGCSRSLLIKWLQTRQTDIELGRGADICNQTGGRRVNRRMEELNNQ